MFMFNDGEVRENMNFKEVCPTRQKEQFAGITYMYGAGVFFYPSGNMVMEENWYLALSTSLLRSDEYTRIPWDWEILKLFFVVQNVSPVWIILDYNAITDIDTVSSKQGPMH